MERKIKMPQLEKLIHTSFLGLGEDAFLPQVLIPTIILNMNFKSKQNSYISDL